MAEKLPEFLKLMKEKDESFTDLLVKCMDRALEEGALSKKTKVLMMMAIDATAEHEEGVGELAGMARGLGATEAEIVETLEIVAISKCMQGLETGALKALK